MRALATCARFVCGSVRVRDKRKRVYAMPGRDKKEREERKRKRKKKGNIKYDDKDDDETLQ